MNLQLPLAGSLCRPFKLADARAIFESPAKIWTPNQTAMQQNQSCHFALPISTVLNEYLRFLGQAEKNVITWLACECLEMAVAKFQKKHAQLVPQLDNATTAPAGFVTGQLLLELLFPLEDCRPSVRWLERMKQRRIIPYYKIGHNVYFDVAKVREKLEKKNLIRAL